jgi:hypothetical protein
MFPNTTTRRLRSSAALFSCAALLATCLHSGVARADEGEPPVTATPPVASIPVPSAKFAVHAEVGSAAANPTSSEPIDRPSASAHEGSLVDKKLLSGFRIGYLFVNDYQKKVAALDGDSIADRANMRSPHQFLVGYEAFYRMVGHSWLNVLLVGNVMVAGLEQSRFYPSANALIGFEFNNNFQVGVGINATPLRDSVAHAMFAAGWTPQAGTFYVPIHVFFVPDVDGNHRMGVTTGVTW